jgi:sugar phosphate isomerase/epimerase
MGQPSIALQLYTLRDFTKTPADIASTFKRVKKIGYNAVQCSALGKIEPAELAKILKGEGLTCCATHIGMDRMKAEPQALADEHKLWGCEYTAIGGYGWQPTPYEKWIEFANEYSALAANLSKLGLHVGYHNHSHELVKINGKTILDILFTHFDKSVWMEIDTYWITHGGGDPIAWINKVSGRIPCVHFKDMAITTERQQQMAEVGEGNLNWPGIIEAAKKAGAKWLIVEQDNCNGKDPFECVERSLKNLQAMGLS